MNEDHDALLASWRSHTDVISENVAEILKRWIIKVKQEGKEAQQLLVCESHAQVNDVKRFFEHMGLDVLACEYVKSISSATFKLKPRNPEDTKRQDTKHQDMRHTYDPELYFMIIGKAGLIGPAEFVRIDEHDLILTSARTLRVSESFRRDVLPTVTEWTMLLRDTPDDVLNHHQTSTYHAALATVLGADLVNNEVKLYRRVHWLRNQLEQHYKNIKSTKRAENLHIALARAALTGDNSTTYRDELLGALADDHIMRKVYKLSQDYAMTKAAERQIVKDGIAMLEDWINQHP